MIWDSGCGTIRGAGSGLFDEREERELEDPEPRRRLSCRFSCREERGGGMFCDACAAMASATGSAVSPSKNLAIAIYASVN